MKQSISITLLLLIAGYFLYRAYKVYFYTPTINFQELSLKDLNNNPANIHKDKLNAAIIVFFQTWCAPCVQEMVLINQHQKEFNFTSVYFITDESTEKVKNLKQRLQADSLNILISNESLKKLDILSYPTIYLIKNSTIIETHKGAIITSANFNTELHHLQKLLSQ